MVSSILSLAMDPTGYGCLDFVNQVDFGGNPLRKAGI